MITLADILSRMNGVSQTIDNMEESLKVNHIDEAIRDVTRVHNLPWNLIKGTLRVFDGVFTYPVPSDYKELAFIDKTTGRTLRGTARPNFMFTSLEEALADITWRNKIAEVWNNGVLTLGIRYHNGPGSTKLKSYQADTATLSGDATAKALDYVFLGEDPCLRVTVVESADNFTVEETFDQHVDTTFQRKYHFRAIYLDSAATSIVLKVGTNGLNYYTATVTTQFDGTPLVGGQLNIVAFDLNTATVVGTPAGIFAWQSIRVNGVTSGFYYLDTSYVRQWSLFDCWYYSKNNVVLIDNSQQESFVNTSATPLYATDARLKGDDLWSDAIRLEAMLGCINEQENQKIIQLIQQRRNRAWNKLFSRYPDMAPLVTTTYFHHQTDFMEDEVAPLD